MTETECTGEAMLGTQCPNDAKWINQNGVTVCDYHKLMLDAFTWNSRNERKWEPILSKAKQKELDKYIREMLKMEVKK